jgi:hypothetical protein
MPRSSKGSLPTKIFVFHFEYMCHALVILDTLMCCIVNPIFAFNSYFEALIRLKVIGFDRKWNELQVRKP